MPQILQGRHRLLLTLALGTALVLSLVAVPPTTVQAAKQVEAEKTLHPPCVEPDNGSGTVTLPPQDCRYLSPDQVHQIINGLPEGTTIIVKPIHAQFICRQPTSTGSTGTETTISEECEIPGGPLGGNEENFGSTLTLHLSGTGELAGWEHDVTVSATVRTFTGPRDPGDDVQEFDTEMDSIVSADHSDSEFAHFKIVGGTANGFPSPGHTVLTRVDADSFRVDSEFDVGYEIEFEGAPGGALEGLHGATEGTVQMSAEARPSTGATP